MTDWAYSLKLIVVKVAEESRRKTTQLWFCRKTKKPV